MSLAPLLRRSLVRAAGWRLLVVFVAATLAPALISILPTWRFLAAHLDTALQAPAVANAMSAPVLFDLMRTLSDGPEGATLSTGLVSALVMAVVVAPFVAGVVTAAARARAREVLTLRDLLRAGGDLYGPMLRMVLVAIVPLVVAGTIAGMVVRAADGTREHAVTAAAASRASTLAAAASAILVVVALVTVDAGRAQLAADPARRGAFFAWLAGLRLLARRPLAALAVTAVAVVVALGGAFVLMAIHGHVPGAGGLAVIVRLLLAQLAAACIGWGRGVRLFGLTELAIEEHARAVGRPVTSTSTPDAESVPPAAASDAVLTSS